MTNKLAPLIQTQVPSFANDEYPVFVSFITAYYEWLDETDNYAHFLNSFNENMDIDHANDDFVTQFLDDFASGVPVHNLKIPKNELVKLIKEFYISKGTEDSFKFIFRILYDKDVNIYYPRDVVLASSDNTYEGDFIMNVTKSINKEYFIKDDSIIYLYDNSSGYRAIVDELKDRVDILGKAYFEAYLSSYDDGIFNQTNMDLKLEIDGIVYNTDVVQTINDIDIIDGGRGYTVGNDVYIVNDPINGNSGLFGKITAVTNGSIESIEIVNGGDNYAVGDSISVKKQSTTHGYGFTGIVREVDGSGTITKVDIVSKGYEFKDEQIGQVTTNYSEVAPTIEAVFNLTGSDLGSIKRIQINDGGHIHDINAITLITTGGINADLTPVFTNIFETPKITTNLKGFTSYNNVLTDSWYYQYFSYLVSSFEPPNQWKYVTKQLLHPSGLVQFGNWLYESTSEDIIGFTGVKSDVAYIIGYISDMLDVDRFLIGVDNSTVLITSIANDGEILTSRMSDLDSEKLLNNFDAPVSYFYDESINSILYDDTKDDELNYMNSTYISFPLEPFNIGIGSYNQTTYNVILDEIFPPFVIDIGTYNQTTNINNISFQRKITIPLATYNQTGLSVGLNDSDKITIPLATYNQTVTAVGLTKN